MDLKRSLSYIYSNQAEKKGLITYPVDELSGNIKTCDLFLLQHKEVRNEVSQYQFQCILTIPS